MERNFGLPQSPIFIVGIMPRSGTNFFHDLLLLHPQCEAGLPAEDFFTAHSDLLVKYVQSISKKWKPHWKIKQHLAQPEWVAMQHIGEGLISFLNLKVGPEALNGDQQTSNPSPQKRVVTKTPSVKNLENFFKLFPKAQLLILVRDGRSVIESGMYSFQWNFEVMTHAWADAAKTILEFQQCLPDSEFSYLVVRYEDVYQQPEKELKKIFSFLGLDTDCYDFQQAVHLPVRGSSEHHRKGKEHLHWKPIEKTQDFNPLQRWSYWSRAKHQRFNWIAGKYQLHFGYCQPTDLEFSVLWQIWNFVLDIKWIIRSILAGIKRFVMKKLIQQK